MKGRPQFRLQTCKTRRAPKPTAARSWPRIRPANVVVRSEPPELWRRAVLAITAGVIGAGIADAPVAHPPSLMSRGKRCGQRFAQHSTTASNERPGDALCGGVTGDVTRGRGATGDVALRMAAAGDVFCRVATRAPPPRPPLPLPPPPLPPPPLPLPPLPLPPLPREMAAASPDARATRATAAVTAAVIAAVRAACSAAAVRPALAAAAAAAAAAGLRAATRCAAAGEGSAAACAAWAVAWTAA